MEKQITLMQITDLPNSVQLAPFRIAPIFVERVWGTNDLRPWYDYIAKAGPIGEVWLTGDECVAETGPYTGQTLSSIFNQEAKTLLGTTAHTSASPLLLKMIFAKDKLSVQVHPDDKMAQKYGEPRGKTECWCALAADAGAKVACGLKPGVTMDKIKSGIHDGTLEESLNMLPVAVGDLIFVDAGTVHAIWPGSILLETQQNCDLTYRMYDYGRPRELHIDKSIEATRLTTRAGKIAPRQLSDRTVLVDVEYFCIQRVPVVDSLTSASLQNGDATTGLAYLFAAAGAAKISGPGFDPVELPTRGIVAIPAASPEFMIENLGGLDLIRILPRWPQNSAQ
jgi:mannose-6-phosphate isomerase